MMFTEPYKDTWRPGGGPRPQSAAAAPRRPRAELLDLHRADGGLERRQPLHLVSAGICALSGPLHGGANSAVRADAQTIHDEGDDGTRFIEAAKAGNRSNRLMGFGHAVYRNFDPRAKIIGKACDELLEKLGINDPLLDIAKNLEEAALKDDYFIFAQALPERRFLQRASSCAPSGSR